MNPANLIQSAVAALAGLLLGAGLTVPHPKQVSVTFPERTVIPVSAALTPAAVQVANDDAADVVSDATTAEAHDAVEPEAVSLQKNTAPAVNPGSARVADESGRQPAGPASVSYYAPRTTYGRVYSCGPNGCYSGGYQYQRRRGIFGRRW